MNTKRLFLIIIILFSLNSVNAQYNLIRNYADSPFNFYVFKEKLYYTGREVGTNNAELWVYDSEISISSTNPKLLIDLDNNPNVGSYPKGFVTYNGKLFFRNNDNLFSYDDNQPISSTNPKIIGNSGNGLIVYNNKLYYEEASEYPNSWLWVYDDNQEISSTNPKKLTDNPLINTTSLGFRFSSLVFNNKLLYCGSNSIDKNYELYVYDSSLSISSTNPKRVYDINNGSKASTPNDFISFNNKLYFTANDGTGDELWSYDGINNPKKTYDLDSSNYGGYFQSKTIYNNEMYFSAHNNSVGTELWKYDGINNPQLVTDIYTGSDFSIPKKLTVYDNKLFFNADNGLNGRELWYYDSSLPTSTTNPTIIDVFLGAESGIDLQNDIIIYHNELYFSGKSSNTNIGLFTLNSKNLGLTEFYKKSDIKIYPNPSSEIMTVESSNENLKSIKIIDAVGRNVFHLDTNNKKEVIKLKNKGIYFMVIETDNNLIEIKKIIMK